MTVYVDWLMNYGWRLRGHAVMSCHMLSDTDDLVDLHTIALKIGMKCSWFQDERTPHYDLTSTRRTLAIEAGAIAIDTREQWREVIKPIIDKWRMLKDLRRAKNSLGNAALNT